MIALDEVNKSTTVCAHFHLFKRGDYYLIRYADSMCQPDFIPLYLE